MFEHRLAVEPDAPFLLASDGRSWTFRDLDTMAGLLDGSTAGPRRNPAGESSGSISGTILPGSSLRSHLAAAAVMAGLRVGLTAAEAVRRFSLVSPKVVISSEPADWLACRSSRWGWPARSRTRTPPRMTSRRPAPRPGSMPSPDDPAAVFFTSGTTGDAKAVLKLHGELADGPRQTAAVYSRSPSFRPRMAAPGKPPALSFNPFGQAAAIGRLIFRLYVGRPLIMIRKFDVAVVQQLAARYPFDTLQLTPAMVHSLAFTDTRRRPGLAAVRQLWHRAAAGRHPRCLRAPVRSPGPAGLRVDRGRRHGTGAV